MKKSILVGKNNDFISLTSLLICGMYAGDPEQNIIYLSPSSTNVELGIAAREKLKESREVDAREFSEIVKSGRIKEWEKLTEQNIKKKYGYKTKNAIYKNMKSINITLLNNEIFIMPEKQIKLDNYTAVKDSEGNVIKFNYNANITEEDLGVAIRNAMNFCISNFW